MKRVVLIVVLACGLGCLSVNAQLTDEMWNTKYKAVEYTSIVDKEDQYLAYVLKEKMTPDYYRYGTYRLKGKYTGKYRSVPKSRMTAMQDVCAVFPAELVKPNELSSLVKNEYLFVLNGSEVWLPIQRVLEKPLQKEIRIGEEAYLYCLLFNSHHENKAVSNIFLISEFSR